jgi:hypothetical protein
MNAPQCYVYTLVGIKRRMDVAKETIEVVKSRDVKPGLYHKRQRKLLTNLRLAAYNFYHIMQNVLNQFVREMLRGTVGRVKKTSGRKGTRTS